MCLPDCILAPRSCQALPPGGRLWPSVIDGIDDGDDDPSGASPVYLAVGVPCQWMCDEKDALTRLAPDEIGQRLTPDKRH